MPEKNTQQPDDGEQLTQEELMALAMHEEIEKAKAEGRVDAGPPPWLRDAYNAL